MVRVKSLDRRLVDAAGAVVLCAFMVGELATAPQAGEHRGGVLAYLLAGAVTLPFAWHRHAPMAALAVTTGATVGYAFGHFAAFPGYALFALLFGISLHAGRVRSRVALAVTGVAMVVSLGLQPAPVVTGSTWIACLLALALAWLSGLNIRSHRLRVAALRERAKELEREREERARQAVIEERLRIARELHDVVAHAMSVIAVQAGVANHVIDSRPEQARQALATVETHTRAALAEMRRLLGVLRRPDEPAAGLAPAPGLLELPALLRRLDEAGLPVDLDAAPAPPGGVPDGVDLSAYRIVQEGLTNVLRHGGPAARVRIAHRDGVVEIEICDDGRPGGAAAAIGGAGQGLLGMRERVAVYDGTLVAGPRPGGGFRLAATLPYATPALTP
jgi:signal transduction histidine kinase